MTRLNGFWASVIHSVVRAKIEVNAIQPEEVAVSATWWVDDYATFTRSILWGRRCMCHAMERPYRTRLFLP